MPGAVVKCHTNINYLIPKQPYGEGTIYYYHFTGEKMAQGDLMTITKLFFVINFKDTILDHIQHKGC